MTNVTKVCLAILALFSFLAYQKLISEPKALEEKAHSVLMQMSWQEGWLEPFVLDNDNHTSEITIQKKNNGQLIANVTFKFSDDTHQICKHLSYSFTNDPLADYELLSQQDCL